MNVDAFYLSGAIRTLREAGYADLVEPFREFLAQWVEPDPAPTPAPEPAPTTPHVLDLLLDQPSEHLLRVVDGYLIGKGGSTRMTQGLRLLLAALQVSPAPVGHPYTAGSCERILRAARADLAEVDAKLAEKVRPPIVREHEVRVVTRRPVRVVLVEERGLQ